MKLKLISGFILFFSFFLTDCTKKKKIPIPLFSGIKGDEEMVTGSGTAGGSLKSIVVSPANKTIAKNTTLSYYATGIYSDGTNKDLTSTVTWDSDTKTTSTIDTAGKASGLAAGTSKISANFNGVTGNANLTVSSATIKTIEVTHTDPIAKGTNQKLKAIAILSDGTTQDVTDQVTWTTDAPSVATVDSTGLAQASTAGTAPIKATLGGVTGTGDLKVKDVTIVSIAVSQSNPLSIGTQAQYTAVATLSDGTTQDVTSSVTWSSSNESVTKVSNDTTVKGLVTAGGEGSSSITATLSGVSGSAPASVNDVRLVSISVGAASSIAKGTGKQFTAMGTFSDGTTKDITSQVTWISSNTDAVHISPSVGTEGYATGLNVGTSTITATVAGISGTAELTISEATLLSIEVSAPSNSLAKGLSQNYTAIGTFSDGTTQDITSQVTWSSTANASVSNESGSNGKVFGTAVGTSNITASLGSVSASNNLTITSAVLMSIGVTPAAPSVAKGNKQQLTATGIYSDGTTQDITSQVTWSSSNTGVATVDNTTSGDNTSVKGRANTLAKGATSVSASMNGKTASVNFTVTDAVLVSIAIDQANPSIAKGTTQQFTVTGTYSDGTTANLTSSVAWKADSNSDGVDDSLVAAISNASGTNGLATASGSTGTSSITATINGITSSAVTLTVTPATLASIAVTPSSDSVAKGYTKQFTATGTYTDGTTQNITSSVTWSSDATSVATISNAGGSEGLATGVSAGSANISATLNGKTGSVGLNVSNAVLVSIGITPAAPSVAKGLTQQFTATGTYSDNSTANITSAVTWTSSDTSKATISNAGGSEGLATTLATGTTTITATTGGVSGNVTLTVSAATIASIAVTPTGQSIAKGLTKQYTATATLTDGTTQDISSSASWTSTDTNKVTVNSTGLATGAGVGSANVTATKDGKSGNSTLTVTAATLVSIAVTPASPSIAKGLPQQFTATGTYTDGSTADITSSVTWSSTNTSVATISNAGGSNGLATTLAIGSTFISAQLNSITAPNVTFNVTAATVASVAVTPANPSVAKGLTQQFTATATMTDSSTQNVTALATWSSSDTSKATISNAGGSEGLATTLATGSSTISAVYSGKTGTTTLTVSAATIASIAVTPSGQSIAKGLTKQYTATATLTDNSTQDISATASWTSTDTSKVTVNSTGLATGAGVGSANVTATKDGKSGSSTLTVTAATLVSIAVTPGSPSVTAGGTQQFTATGSYTDGTTQDLTSTVTWSSSATSVATISNAGGSNGLATSASAGTATITASLGGVTSTGVTLTVNPAITLNSISISPKGDTVATGFTKQFTATGSYSNGTTADLTSTVTWSSSNTGVATISNASGSNGLATPVTGGSTTISASYGGKSDSTTLTVSSITLTGISISENATYPVGATKQYTAWGNFSDGSKVNITSQVTWTSSATSAASISNASGSQGLATTLAAGATTITATKSGVTGTATLTVKAENETAVTDTFSGSITSNIPIDLVVKDQNGVAVSGVVIKIFDASTNGNVLFQALSDGSGRVSGTLTIPMNSSSITVYGQGYKGGYTSTMQDIVIVKDVSGTLKITFLIKEFILDTTVANLNTITITDTDGDGVEDANDAYPSDASKAFKTRFPSLKDKVYSLNIENNWPNPSNMDLNDYTVQFYNEEDTNASGKIVEIRGNYEVIVRGRYKYESQTIQLRFSGLDVSEYKATYYRYDGTQRPSSWTVSTVSGGADTDLTVTNPLVITNPTATQLKDNLVVLPKSSSAAATDVLLTSAGVPATHSTGGYKPTYKPFRPGDIGRISIKLNTPASRDEVGNAPYDLYMRFYQTPSTSASSLKEIHVAGSGYVWTSGETTYCSQAPISGSDADCIGKDKYKANETALKFAWGFVVPGVWKPQIEGNNLNSASASAYPKFIDWISSNGNTYPDWYKASNIVNSNAYQILNLPNKHLCLDCSASEAYDPGTAGNNSGAYYCGTSAGSPTGCVLGDLPASYATTPDVAFIDVVKQKTSSLMAYLKGKSAKMLPLTIIALLSLGVIFVLNKVRSSRA